MVAPEDVSPLTIAARRDLYGDALNENLLMRPGQQLTAALVAVEDSGIDGTTEATGHGIGSLSTRLRGWQNGFVRSYALSTFAGAAIVLRDNSGGGVVMGWLTVLWLVPAVAAAGVVAIPSSRAEVAKWVARPRR